MEKYNYHKALENDICQWIADHLTPEEFIKKLRNPSEFKSWLHERMFDCEDITGNGENGYPADEYSLQEFVCGNLDYFEDAVKMYGTPEHFTAEFIDCWIRLSLLDTAIEKALEKICDYYGINYFFENNKTTPL